MTKNKCFKSSIAALSIISLSVMSTFVAMRRHKTIAIHQY